MNNLPESAAYFVKEVENILPNILKSCLLLIPLFLFIQVAYSLVTGLIVEKDITYDVRGLIRGILIWITVAGYMVGMDAFSFASRYLEEMVPKRNVMEVLTQVSKNVMTNDIDLKKEIQDASNKDVDESGNPTTRITDPDASKDTRVAFNNSMGQSRYWWDIFGSMQKMKRTIIDSLTMFLAEGLALIIRLSMERIRMVLLGFLYLVGPIALSLSIVPAFRGLALHWFRIWLSTSLWALTLAILDNLMIAYYISATANPITLMDASGLIGNLDFVVVMFVFIVCYLLTPVLTSYYIQASGASEVASAVGRTTQTLLLAGMARIPALARFMASGKSGSDHNASNSPES